ncbi:hypothetical protein Leryth_023332, partial [Lithospermum erythrorhizon]
MEDSENRRLEPSLTSMFKDISNLKTPKNPKYDTVPSSPFSQSKFFTASKITPVSSLRRGSSVRSKTARKLKAFELEQNKSARKAQTQKEKSLKSLSKSLTVWLNFLFESPGSCGCESTSGNGEVGWNCLSELKGNGKRDSGYGRDLVRVDDGLFRGPKRQRGVRWKGNEEEEMAKGRFCDVKFSGARNSLKEICSFDDLQERMRVYMSLGSCKEIFETMTLAAKSIDEGRLKMRLNCPIVSDVGMKEKAVRILMSYNPIWLRIGLYIILGGDSLMPNGDANNEQDIAFVKIVIEKQFFSHPGLAKFYSYNKLVDGLYRPGYYEKLGSVILKRFLLLVLVLDRAKSQSSLPLKYGIDGLDGGSPLLFSVRSSVKTSSQMINDFLSSDVMHGEGNLLTHLVILGYKVTHQQIPLTEYEFKVTDLFEDLQDGVRLCRAIQLLQNDCSILMKMVVPSDSRKKSLVNCDTALQYLKQTSVPLFDDDGIAIVRDDIANGDKELLLSLLWNMFVHLQVPLLVNKKILAEEIYKIRGVVEEYPSTSTLLDMLLKWIQATCACYDLKVVEFSSLVDGKAMWCLLDYYFRKEHKCTTSFKALGDSNGEVSIVSANDYTDALHNFILSQKLTSLLGNFPEVLQVSDLLEHNCACNDRSVVILLVFLSFQLLVKRNMDQLNFHKLLGFDCQSSQRRQQSTERWSVPFDVVRDAKEFLQDDIGAAQGKFKAIMTWWQEMAQQNKKCEKPYSRHSSLTSKNGSAFARENAATIIQAHFRCSVLRRHYLKVKNAVCILQSVLRAWLAVKGSKTSTKAMEELVVNAGPDLMYLIDRQRFSNLRKSALVIQRAIRAQIAQRYKHETTYELSPFNPVRAAITIQNNFLGGRERMCMQQKFFRGGRARLLYMQQVRELEKAAHSLRAIELDYNHEKAVLLIQRTFRQFISRTFWLQHFAVIKIQCSYRGWQSRKKFIDVKIAVLKIQSTFRCIKCQRLFKIYKQETKSAIVIQRYIRGRIARQASIRERDAVRLQKELSIRMEAITLIHSSLICMKYRKTYLSCRQAAIQIQALIRGEITRKRMLGASSVSIAPTNRLPNAELNIFIDCVLKLQRWWRGILLIKIKTKSAILIQSNVRGWLARRRATRENVCIVLIQSYWRGYIARRNSKVQLVELRQRVKISAANVDDNRRLINRLTAAVSELLNMRSVSGILHTCQTLGK